MARPSKLTPEIQTRLCRLLQAGNTHEVSAEACGINVSTFYRWVRDKPEFAAAVEQAEAEAEAVLVARISQAAANGSWRAAGWLLERRNPDKWGREGRSESASAPSDAVGSLYEVSNPGRIRTKAS